MLDKIIKNKKLTIQKLVECIGVSVAACPAVAYGWLFHKQLEVKKIRELRRNNNPNIEIILPEAAIKELKWCQSLILTTNNKIRNTFFDIQIYSDASTAGWGPLVVIIKLAVSGTVSKNIHK